jgi:hypothetical protein
MSEGEAFNASVPARPILSQSGTSSRLYFLDIGELADGDYEVALVTARQLQRLKDILNSIEIDTNK